MDILARIGVHLAKVRIAALTRENSRLQYQIVEGRAENARLRHRLHVIGACQNSKIIGGCMDEALRGMYEALEKIPDQEFVERLEQLRIQYPTYIIKQELLRRLTSKQPPFIVESKAE